MHKSTDLSAIDMYYVLNYTNFHYILTSSSIMQSYENESTPMMSINSEFAETQSLFVDLNFRFSCCISKSLF